MKQMIEIERRWALSITPSLPLPYQIYLLTQSYLHNPDGKAERIRQSLGVETHFYHTIKTPLQNQIGQHEQESEIDFLTYLGLMKRINSDFYPITKERKVFEFNGLKYELDSFLYPVKFLVLEVEIPTIETPVEIPDFLGPVVEVTGKTKLSNFRIAQDPKAAMKSMKKALTNSF